MQHYICIGTCSLGSDRDHTGKCPSCIDGEHIQIKITWWKIVMLGLITAPVIFVLILAAMAVLDFIS